MNEQANQEYITVYRCLIRECAAIYHDLAVQMGLSDCAFWILCALRDADHALTQSEIVRKFAIPKQTVNSALKKLEKDNYLTLLKNDGCVGKSISLTQKGRQYIQVYISPVISAEETVLQNLTDCEIENFLMVYRALVKGLKTELEHMQQ